MRSEIRKNCELAKLRYSTASITPAQSQLLLSLLSLKHYLDLDEFLLLLKYHSEYR